MLSLYYETATKRQRLLMSLVLAAIVATILAACLMLTCGTVYAAEDDVFTRIANAFDSLYSSIGVVVTALGAVAIGICAFKWIMGSDPTAVRAAKTWMLNIAIGLAIFWLAKVIVDTIQSIVQTTDTAQILVQMTAI